MCLHIKFEQVAVTATQDIKCYKVLRKDKFGVYESPYRGKTVLIGMTYELEAELEAECGGWPEVNKGLHTFVKFNDAVNECKEWKSSDRSCYSKDSDRRKCKYVIVESIIPTDAKYYEGAFNDVKSYASSEVKYNEIIKEI
jgi:hypothetical protein